MLIKKLGKKMKAKIRWVEQAMFVGESGSGHAIVMDGPPEFGGQDLGIRPMEMLLLGMGGCTAFDVVLILNRGKHVVEKCTIELEAERSDTPPKVFTHITINYVIEGKNLTEKTVQRAIDLSAEKYCSASIMLGQVATIAHEFKIINTD